MTGVRVSPGYAISTLAAADALTAAPGEAPEGELVAVNGKLGLALFRLADEVGQSRLPTRRRGFTPGAWLGRGHQRRRAGPAGDPGASGVDAPSREPSGSTSPFPFPPSFDVAAVVDLDSRLAGVALRGPDGVQVLTTEAASAIVQGLASSPSCRAVDVVPLPDAVREALRLTSGVAVESVTTAAFADPPDLRPGDILLQLGHDPDLDPGGVRGGLGQPGARQPGALPDLPWQPTHREAHRGPGTRLPPGRRDTPGAAAARRGGPVAPPEAPGPATASSTCPRGVERRGADLAGGRRPRRRRRRRPCPGPRPGGSSSPGPAATPGPRPSAAATRCASWSCPSLPKRRRSSAAVLGLPDNWVARDQEAGRSPRCACARASCPRRTSSSSWRWRWGS